MAKGEKIYFERQREQVSLSPLIEFKSMLSRAFMRSILP